MSEKKPWFRPKNVGYGWTPQTWQGFAVVFVPIALFVVVALALTR